MLQPRRVAGALLPFGLAVVVTTCDVLTSPGLRNVSLSYVGDSVLVVGAVGVASVEVRAEGGRISRPRLDVTVSDTAIAAVRNDSLFARRRGTVTLTAQLLSAALPESPPAVQQEVRVVVKDVTVTPAADTLTSLGDTLLLQGAATDVNDAVIAGVSFTWASSDTAVATVTANGRVQAKRNGTAEVSAIADDDTATALIVVEQQVAAFTFAPASVFLESLGETAVVTATGRDARGNVIPATQPTWTTLNGVVASVDGSGTVTARGNGATYIVATGGGVSDSLTATVDQAATSVVISATQGLAITSIGDHLQLAATATDNGGSVVMDAPVGWATLDPTLAVVSLVGEVTAVGEGEARITASLDRAADTVTVNVTNEPVTLDVTPDEAVLASIGDTLRLTATVRNGRGDPVTGLTVGWSTPSPAVLDVLPTGRAIAIGTGTARVIGAVGGVADTSRVTVTNAPDQLAITSPDATLTSLGDEFVPEVIIKNARGADLPRDAVTWTSDNEAIAPVSAFGEIMAVDTGVARIRATSGALADTIFVTVQNLPDAVALFSHADTLTALGQQLQYDVGVWNARGNPIHDYPVLWASSNPALVAVDTGLVTARSVGAVWVRALAGPASDSARVVVVNPSLVHVDNSVYADPQFGTLKRPYGTIQAAVDASDAGDTVFVHIGSGEYPESVALTRQTVLLGDSTSYVNSDRDPLLLPRIAHDTGTAAITAHTTAAQRIWYLTVVHTLDGAAVDAAGSDVDINWLYVNPTSTTTTRIGRGISIEGSLSGTQVQNSVVRSVRGYGIRLLNTSNARVTGSTVWAVDSIPGVEPGAGIHVAGGERNLLQSDVVRYSQGPQIFLDGAELSEVYGNDLRGANQLLRMVGITRVETRVNGNRLDASAMSGETVDYQNPPFAVEIRDSPGTVALADDSVVQASGPTMNGMRVRHSWAVGCWFCYFGGVHQAVQLDTAGLVLWKSALDSVRFGVRANGRSDLTIDSTTVSRMIEGPCVTVGGNASNVRIVNSAFTDCWRDSNVWADNAAVVLWGDSSQWEISKTTFQGEEDFAISFGQGGDGRSAARIRDNVMLGRGDGANLSTGMSGGAITGSADTVVITGNRITNWRFAEGSSWLAGIKLGDGDTIVVDSNLVSHNTFGLRIDDLALGGSYYFRTLDNDFYDNDSLGVRHLDLGGAILTAEHNWWGDRRGPRRTAQPEAVGDSLAPMTEWDFDPYNTAPLYPGSAAQSLRLLRGGDQRAPAGTMLPLAFSVRVVDAEGRPVAGVRVTFTVVEGGGNLGGAASVDVVTLEDGLAEAALTLGPSAGDNRVTVAGTTEPIGSITVLAVGL